MQRRKEHVPAPARLVPSLGEPPVDLDHPEPTLPARARRTEETIHGGALGLRRLGVEKVQIHS